ncbi:hypothetical protein AGMMS50293_13150 [Spirochaetia bacterium]|nr:hypothetical protein AGMMS50293_13150 [Spirochaetia bacterium]
MAKANETGRFQSGIGSGSLHLLSHIPPYIPWRGGSAETLIRRGNAAYGAPQAGLLPPLRKQALKNPANDQCPRTAALPRALGGKCTLHTLNVRGWGAMPGSGAFAGFLAEQTPQGAAEWYSPA